MKLSIADTSFVLRHIYIFGGGVQMSTSIHCHIEVKVGSNWHHYSNPSIDQNYLLFARAAGVRNDWYVIPIAEPRGIPNDISLLTQLDYHDQKGDAHSESWLNAEELGQLIHYHHRLVYGRDEYITEQTVRRQWGYLFGNSFENFKRFQDEYPEWLEDVRLIFWFDN